MIGARLPCLALCILCVMRASPLEGSDQTTGSIYAAARSELQQARVSATLPAVSTRWLRRPDVSNAPALRLFISGYTAMLRYDRAAAERDLADSFRLSPSGHAALALATNAFEIGKPEPLIKWTTRGLESAGALDAAVEIELRLLHAQALAWTTRYDEQYEQVAHALAMAQQYADPAVLAVALRAHAGVLDHRGQKAQALDVMEQAIQISAAQGQEAVVGYHMLTMSGFYYPIRTRVESVALLERALAIANRVHDRHLQARLIASRGLANLQLSRYGAAQRDLIAAEALFRTTGGLRSRATTAGNLSVVFAELGDYQRAEQQAWLATSLYRQISNPRGVRESLDSLGHIALRQGLPALAVRRHERVVAYSREVGDRKYLAGALVRLALAYFTRSQWPAAERAVNEAIVLADEFKDRDAQISAQVALGDLRRATGLDAEAERHYRAALDLGSSSNGTVTSFVRLHHGLALVAARSGKPEIALPHLRSALDLVERVRGGAGDPEFRLAYFSDKTSLHLDIIGALVDAYRQTGDDAHLREALGYAERAKARTLLDAVSGAPATTGPDVSIAAMASALEPTDAMVEFAVGAQRSFVFTLRRDQTVRVFELPGRGTLEGHVQSLRDAIVRRPLPGDDGRQMRRSADRASSTLLAPVMDAVSAAKRLIIIADGPLVYLPFEALTIPGSQLYLTERYEIVRSASASVLGLTRGRPDAAPAATEFVGFGDPHVDGVATGSEAELIRALERDGFSFSPLPGTRREIEASGALFAPRTRIHMGRAFTAAIAIEELQRTRGIVHFATHAILDEHVPERSGIVVSPSGPDAATILRARDLAALKTPASLVVLSACETGLGRIVDGEGVLGLSWAFTRAGASSLLVTLWNVSDAAGAPMMVPFYQALAAGQTKSAALRTARLQLLQGPNPALRHPYYWAAYALIGNPD
jgi:CHAT domain-containing protein/tetratricopeptide (TPR) repeat protein